MTKHVLFNIYASCDSDNEETILRILWPAYLALLSYRDVHA